MVKISDIIKATYQEVEDFYKEIFDTNTPRVKKYMVYDAYKKEIENEKKIIALEQSFTNDKMTSTRFYAQIVSDDIVIMYALLPSEVVNTRYHPCFYDNNTYQITKDLDVDYETFEEALLSALIYKYNDDDSCMPWVKKLMSFPEKENTNNNK